MRDLSLTVLTVSLAALLGLSLWSVDGYRLDSRIQNWSPTWLSSSNPQANPPRVISRLDLLHGLYDKRWRGEEFPVYKWSPWYFPKKWNQKRASSIFAWDGGDSHRSAGSPEWFKDELFN